MWILAKNDNGNCIFLDDKTTKCKRYDERTLECQIYPFLLDFSKEIPEAKLDKRFCPHLKTLHFDKEKISTFIKKFSFPQEWIKAYETLEDY